MTPSDAQKLAADFDLTNIVFNIAKNHLNDFAGFAKVVSALLVESWRAPHLRMAAPL